MSQVTRKGLITVAAAGGVLALGGGYAHADSGAQGNAVKSPGVLSGNTVQVPVHIPINACGNTVNVVGVLNPAVGNACANGPGKGHGTPPHGTPPHGTPPRGGAHDGGAHDEGGYGGDGLDTTPPRNGSYDGGQGGGSQSDGGTANSSGVGSGNTIQIPIDIPVNVCGLGITAVGVGNPVTGNGCENDSPAVPVTPGPGKPVQPGKPGTRAVPPAPNVHEAQSAPQPVSSEELAQTGAGQLGTAIPVGVGLLLAGGILYRRARSATRV